MKLFKLLFLTILMALSLHAQPTVNEQILTASGGKSVAMTNEYAIVGDPDNHTVHFYKLDYSDFQWKSDGNYTDGLFGDLGSSVAIDGNIAVAGSPSFSENRIFRFRGANKKVFEEYIISRDAWEARADTPDNIGDGGALAWGGGNFIYAFRGNKNKTFYKYDILNDLWTTLDNAPENVAAGGALVWDRGNYIYALRGAGGGITSPTKKDFWRFDMTTEKWNDGFDPANLPGKVGGGGALVLAEGDIYAVRGEGDFLGTSTNDFYKYVIATDTWTSMPDTTRNVGKGASLAYDGTRGIYLLRGNIGLSNKKKFYDFDIPDNNWEERAETPDGIGKGGALVFDGTFFYAQRGDTSFFGGNNKFWRYDPYRDVWLGDLSEPTGNTGWGGALTVVKDAPGEGIVYVFERDATTWQRKLRISSDAPTLLDNLGEAVAVHNKLDGTAKLVVGAPGFSATNGTGSATIVDYDHNNLPVSGNKAVTLSNSAPTGSVRFGSAIDMKGDAKVDPAKFFIVVGDQNYSSNDGAAYAYDNIGASYPASPDNQMVGSAGSHFGRSVAIDATSFTNGLSVVAEDTRNSFWTGGTAPWTEATFEGTILGSVAIDDRTILSTNAPLGNMTPTLGLMHFFPLTNNLSLIPNALTEYQLSSSNANIAIDSDIYKEIAIVNDPVGTQAIVMDVPCGLRPTELVAFEWAMVSVPCGDGTATINEIFADDITGSYGDDFAWVMYKDGPNYTGKASDNVVMTETDVMELGKGYWIIADQNATLKADAPAITQRSGSIVFTDTFPEVGGYLEYALPMSVNGTVKKIMVGNPFPRALDWNFAGVHNSQGNYLLHDQTFGDEYNPTGYVYDSSQTAGTGQPYRAVTATPGFGSVIEPYQAFWIRDNGNFSGTNPDRKFFLPFMK